MKKVIIVGAGSTGLEIAGRIQNSVIIDADPGKIMILKREHPDRTIVGGDATDPDVLKAAGIDVADSLVLCTNKDYYSQKIALTARKMNDEIKILAVLHEKKNAQKLKDAGIDVLISPISETIDAFLSRLIPVGERITEIAISHQSPALGVKIRDIELPPETTIGAILRGHHLLKPEPDIALENGDVISIVSLGQLEEDVVDAICGTTGTMVPIDHFICMLLDEEDLKTMDEMIFLASRVTASCHFVMPDKMIHFQHKLIEKCEKLGVRVTIEPYMGNILEKFRNIVAGTGPERNCMFVLPQRKLSILRYHLPSHYIESLVSISLHPLYVPKVRQFKKFERVVHLIDGSHHSGLSASYALGLARVNDTVLNSLVSHVSENNNSEETLIHTKRIGKVYEVEVVEEIIEGNPTLEFIRKVKETANQLVIINWNCETLRRDILRKILNEAEASVLLMK